MTRFSERRRLLRMRHVCTRCAREKTECGRTWCASCLAVESDKRDIRTDAEARRRVRIEKRRAVIVAAYERIRAETTS